MIFNIFLIHIWPCRKKVKGEPRAIIWPILVDLESLKLHTKIKPQRFLGSWEDF